MSEPVATLTVDGPFAFVDCTVRVDGDLPTICEWCRGRELPDHDCSNFGTSLLWVGDRVTLATRGHHIRDGRPGPQGVIGWQSDAPFATATVAKVEQEYDNKQPISRSWLVTVTDVEELS